MLDPTGVYDRALRRLSRRDLMKVAWALGASAVALPAEARRQSGVSMFFNAYPFSLGVASGDPLPDGIVLWTRLAPQPLDGGGMPMVPVPVQWELAARRGVPHDRAEGGDPGAARAGAQRSRRGERTRAGARVLVSLPRRQRSQPDRAHANGAGGRRRGGSAALRRLRLQPLRDRLFHRLPAHRAGAVRLRHPHRRLHLRVARRRRPERGRASASTPATRSTRWSTTATATASTSRIPTSSPRTARRRSSSAGTITRSRTTTPATSTRTARRRRSSCCAAPPRTRRTTSTCRCGCRPGRPARTCASTGGCSSAA